MKLKRDIFVIFKIGILTVIMFLSFAVAASIAGLGASTPSPEEASQAAIALLGVCLVDTLVLTYLIVHTRWHGLKLIGTVILLYFGTETFMSQIETLFFGSTFNISTTEIKSIILSGFLRALFFSPLAVVILGKLRANGEPDEGNSQLSMPLREWGWRLVLLPIIYVCLYFLFGYFVAWQSSEVRQFYSGSTNIKPFFDHLLGILQDNPQLLLFQVFRGLLWIGLGVLAVRMMKGKVWQISLAVGLLFGLLLTIQLLLPNPYMPSSVRLVHFVETSISTFIYGALIGWLFSRSYPLAGSRQPLENQMPP